MSIDSLDWTLCRSFLAILRKGSLSGAARVLGVAHPTVRRHLEEIEENFHEPLFVRSPSGLAPTELAQSLRDPAEAMESAFQQLVRTASGAGDAVAGTVRITASEVMGAEVLPPMLRTLRDAHPALEFEVELSDDVADVLRRDADIAVRMLRPTQSELVARRVANVPLGLYVHRRWLEANGAPASLGALVKSRQLIGYDRQMPLITALSALGVRAESRDFGFRSDSTLAQLAAMRAGLGVAVCHMPIAARDPALVRVLPDFTLALETWLVSHPNLRGSLRVRACLDALAKSLATYAAEDTTSRGD